MDVAPEHTRDLADHCSAPSRPLCCAGDTRPIIQSLSHVCRSTFRRATFDVRRATFGVRRARSTCDVRRATFTSPIRLPSTFHALPTLDVCVRRATAASCVLRSQKHSTSTATADVARETLTVVPYTSTVSGHTAVVVTVPSSPPSSMPVWASVAASSTGSFRYATSV